jgi:putative ABC transport system permease protein
VDASYFETVGTTILDGRGFTSTDRRGSRPICVVNATAAAVFWAAGRALGQQVFVGDSAGGEWLTVVGVAATIEQGEMASRQLPTIYRPLDQAPLYHPAASLYVRLTRGGGTDLTTLQRAVAGALGHPASAFRPVAADLDRRFRTQRFNALALDLFAAFALMVAAIGIYGSVAYVVTRRTREIGVRLALGAERSRVIRLVAGRTAWVVAAGLLIGTLGSLVLSRTLRVFVSATSTTDPRILAATAFLACMVALIAAYLPARRATGVDPITALRSF